ncbi:hydantoinase B/oxoprolinase family protein [Nibrella saemangeumensis]|uniref:Hydantoinase B/oxoprolinase family protein n=1 Tax=Nibrella saemangeumensis TaxID=1084526 RepID=A0ABP8NQQ3_9BACT
MYQIWIDTGGTFTDGMALAPGSQLLRTKVLSSSCLRGILRDDQQQLRLKASWLSAPIFEGYQLRIIDSGEIATVVSLAMDGALTLDQSITAQLPATVELLTGEEAPVLATRLLTQTPLNRPFPPLDMRLGTTRGTNALLERKGGRVALLVTKGFRDLLRIGTQQRPDLFQLDIPPPELLYTDVYEVEERISAGGQVLTKLEEHTIAGLVEKLKDTAVDAIAVSLLNAYRNPVHERQLGDALQAAGLPVVTLSTDVSTAIQYVSRTQTAVVDAYLTPVLRAYLDNLTRQLGGQPVRVMTSAGGLVKADLFRPKDSLLSGPAGGVIGSAAIARELDIERILTLDMGGTSTDTARYDHRVDYRFTTKINAFELQLPSLAIETVAAGGGSVCWFDGAQLQVGPHSAGAAPGPACYGAGGPLCITDVNLLLGKLHPGQFGIPVFPDQAKSALHALQQRIAEQTSTTISERDLLLGFARIADEAMAGAIRKISVARGFDPREYALLVFGGAGGLHGCSVARLLGIDRLILPFDGGLLSAYGIGQARIERMVSQPVLQELSAVETELANRIAGLTQQATDALRQDVGPETPVAVQSVLLFLRLQGQETAIEVPLVVPTDVVNPTAFVIPTPGGISDATEPAKIQIPPIVGMTKHDVGMIKKIEDTFQEKYQQLYGHYPTGKTIEVESIRVVVSTVREEEPVTTQPVSHTHVLPIFTSGSYPVYDWTQLREGDTFRGPALLLNKTSSAFIEPGWRLVVRANQNAVAEYVSSDEEPYSELAEVAQTELFARRFTAIAEEMGAQLQRTAFSVNVKERLDFSCALLDENAELLVNAPHIPVHLGSLGICARLVQTKIGIGPGDVVITNHPKYGGSHLPDITLLSGVFTDAGELLGYVINRAHHAEIGGKVPGSMPPDAVNLAEEGVVLEPQYLVRRGVFRWEDVAQKFTQAPYPTRALAENRADIEAALASLRAGEQALLKLVRDHGLPTLQHYMRRLKQASADALRTVLAPLEDQTFEAEERLDDGQRIFVSITIFNQIITFDFTGTSDVHKNNLNANRAILFSAILYVLRLWIRSGQLGSGHPGSGRPGKDIPLNEGLMEPVRILLPESSFLNPDFGDTPEQCPAVVGGNTEVSQRLVDTLLKALGLAACSQGTMNNFLFGNSQFGYYETIGGGTGAGPGFNGRSAVHQHMTNTRLTDPEELERRYPVRLHQFAIRTGSGGAGRWRGGDGIIREIEFLAPVQTTLLSQHRVVSPYGMQGGQPGQTGQQTLIRADGNEQSLPGIFSRPLQPGDRIRIETPGGGGWGSDV